MLRSGDLVCLCLAEGGVANSNLDVNVTRLGATLKVGMKQQRQSILCLAIIKRPNSSIVYFSTKFCIIIISCLLLNCVPKASNMHSKAIVKQFINITSVSSLKDLAFASLRVLNSTKQLISQYYDRTVKGTSACLTNRLRLDY